MPHPLGTTPSRVFACHLNFRSRAAERGRVPSAPSFFTKPAAALSGTGDPLVLPDGCARLAFEGEVALVIGTRAHHVAPEDGWAHVGWITAANDAGIDDLRYADLGANVRSKGSDGYSPLGPRLLDARTVDPAALRLRTWVNGELVQDDTTDTLLFPFGLLVADLSRTMTLEPGDVILTGTPRGAGFAAVGDLIEVEVDNGDLTTGRLRNEVVSGAALADFGAQPRTEPSFGLDPALRADLMRISTATIASQLRKRGLHQHFIEGVQPTRPELKMVGTARTLRYLPLREDQFAARGGGMNAQKKAIEALDPGDVLVMDARRDGSSGTIGDILALRAQVRGATGVVTDGGVRDIAAVTALDLPVYHAGAHPAVLGRRHVPWDVDLPVACGGALVQRGDLIVGDADGVLVLPPELAASLVDDCAEQELQERFIAEQVASGASVDGLYPIGPAWLGLYEKWRSGNVAR